MSETQKPKVIRSNRRTLALQVLPNATLVVRSPLFMPQFLINRFIKQNQDWIKRRLAQVKEKKVTKREYQEGEEFLYLGLPHKLKIGNFKNIEFKEGYLQYPNFLVFRIQKELSTWYINQAKKLITREVKYYAGEMKTSFKELRFSDTRSKWGSCTHDNRLQFSWRLIMTPLLVLKYVIIHELAHTFEKNHSSAFWSKVRLYNPSYKQQIKWLKANGRSLVI
jgi:predicted metal-dependent hydrolase